MRQMIINVITFGSVAGLLTHMGYFYYSWEFWGVIIGMVIVQINNAIDEQ